MLKPRKRLNGPAINLFNMAICKGSARDTLRVRLSSSPHATQAPMIAIGLNILSKFGAPDHDNTIRSVLTYAPPVCTHLQRYKC
jgi:hypothetical protein